MNLDNNKQPRRSEWPFPGDSPLARARRIAQMYRQALNTANPQLCNDVDETACSFGETWAVPRLVIHRDDDLLRPIHAADFLCISPDALRLLRNRGRLIGELINGVWHYRVHELRKVTEKRERTPN